MKTFNALSRPTDYETAKMLADREDMMTREYVVPEMKTGYPKMKIREGAGLWNLLTSCLP